MAEPGSIDMYKTSITKHAQKWSGAITAPSAKLGAIKKQIGVLEEKKQLSAEEKSALDKLKKEAQKIGDQIDGATKVLNLSLSKVELPENKKEWNEVGTVIQKVLENQSVQVRKNLSVGFALDIDVKNKKADGASVNINLDF